MSLQVFMLMDKSVNTCFIFMELLSGRARAELHLYF